MKKRTLRSNQETDEGKRCAALANSLTKKAPYKGLGAESGEKREPASDIDTAVVDRLKALVPEGALPFYLRSSSAKVLPKRAGDGETLMPAASMAAILLSASPLPPEMMAPAWPMRRPGGAVRPAMNPTIGFLRPCLASSARN